MRTTLKAVFQPPNVQKIVSRPVIVTNYYAKKNISLFWNLYHLSKKSFLFYKLINLYYIGIYDILLICYVTN